MSSVKLYQGDCLEILPLLSENSVDFILTDPPYGTTDCKWDAVIPFEPMWEQIWRVLKPNGACVLFGAEPFSSALRMSQIKCFKYDWTWDKHIPSGMGYAKYRPMQQTEVISTFSNNGGKTVYYPQKIKRDTPIKSGGNNVSTDAYGGFKCVGVKEYKKTYEYKNPITLLKYNKIRKGSQHPTQKPVDLLEYLIKTYTQEGETVLDFTMGSGSTGVACKNINRNFIGIEKEEKYMEIARTRMGEQK